MKQYTKRVYFVEQKHKFPLQCQLKRGKIIFKAVDNYVPRVAVRSIEEVHILNKEHMRVESRRKQRYCRAIIRQDFYCGYARIHECKKVIRGVL